MLEFLPTLITAILIAVLSIIVLFSNKKNITNIFYSIFSFLCIFWLVASFCFDHSTEIVSATALLIASNISGVWFVYSLILFVVIFTSLSISRVVLRLVIASGIVPLSLSLLMMSPYAFPKLEEINGYFIPPNNLFVYLLMAYYVCSIACVALVLIWKLIQSRNSERLKIKYVLIGLFISGATALFPSVFASQIGLPQLMVFSPLCLLFFIVATSYGILKGGLFDVRTAIVRSVTYSLVLATMAGIYVGTTSILSAVLGFGQSTWAELFGNIAISLTLVFIFQPIKKFFDKITNKIFYKDNYNSDEFFARLNKTLALTTDLRGLLERTATEIGKTLKSSQAFFFINTEENHVMTAGTKNHTQLQKSDADAFVAAPKDKSGVLIASLLDESDAIKQKLGEHKIEIVLPLIQDGKTLGLLCLGEHLSSNYTNRDIQVLDTISNELIIAIQNALSVQEIRDFNVTLKREIANATQELRIKNAMLKKLDKAKDEFVSMASHQLRTPLTSVKGYLSMVIEGDAGKLSKPQKDLLDEAYTSNEKMVHLVNDFLNVSRIQTGKFMLEKAPVDLPKLVSEEIDGLRQNAKAHNLNLICKAPSGFPKLNIDEGKIRQVVMNFADNALYYSHPDTDVNISLSVDGDDALFTVKDTGIGVPIDEQGQLFTKFYRASNARKARPDGTGVGLYLAKKIITAHDGKIVFSTIEGKGSTFGFRLPIKELEVSSDEAYNLKE